MKRTILSVALVLLAAGAAEAQEATNPIRWTWMATSCKSWNCAASALVLADGDKYVIALPTGRDETPWLILKRVEEGSVYIPPEEPYACQVFQSVIDAGAAFTAMDTCHGPLMLNVPDGRAVVVSLNSCDNSGKQRAVR